jgi:hypothetical protein
VLCKHEGWDRDPVGPPEQIVDSSTQCLLVSMGYIETNTNKGSFPLRWSVKPLALLSREVASRSVTLRIHQVYKTQIPSTSLSRRSMLVAIRGNTATVGKESIYRHHFYPLESKPLDSVLTQ